jgi:hypothetical protein
VLHQQSGAQRRRRKTAEDSGSSGSRHAAAGQVAPFNTQHSTEMRRRVVTSTPWLQRHRVGIYCPRIFSRPLRQRAATYDGENRFCSEDFAELRDAATGGGAQRVRGARPLIGRGLPGAAGPRPSRPGDGAGHWHAHPRDLRILRALQVVPSVPSLSVAVECFLARSRFAARTRDCHAQDLAPSSRKSASTPSRA